MTEQQPPTFEFPEGPPAWRTQKAEQLQPTTSDAEDTPRAQFGAGRLEGVQPTYYALRGFGVRVFVYAKDGKSPISSTPWQFLNGLGEGARWEDDHDDYGAVVGPIQTHYKFEPGINLATCQLKHSRPLHGTTIPDARCMCGFYGYLSPDSADARPWRNSYMHYPLAYVQAVVALSGKRFVGTRGVRAERLRIMAFAGLPRPADGLADRSQGGLEASRMIEQHAGDLRAAVERRFPDVPYFPNVDLMLAAFPLTRLREQPWTFGKPLGSL